jgi:coilin
LTSKALLQIKFSTLHEVRLVRHGNLESAKSIVSGSNEVHVRDQDSGTGFSPNNNHEANTSAQGINSKFPTIFTQGSG